MPRYRLKPGAKHFHMGQRYEGAESGRKGEFPDVLELDSDRASRIANKLIPLDGGDPLVPPKEHQRPVVEKEEEKKEELEQETSESVPEAPAVPSETDESTEQADQDSESPSDSEPKESDVSEEEAPAPSLSLKYLGDEKWNVMQGDKPVNDVPLSEAEAKALVEGAK